jgi:hypothetical protein
MTNFITEIAVKVFDLIPSRWGKLLMISSVVVIIVLIVPPLYNQTVYQSYLQNRLNIIERLAQHNVYIRSNKVDDLLIDRFRNDFDSSSYAPFPTLFNGEIIKYEEVSLVDKFLIGGAFLWWMLIVAPFVKGGWKQKLSTGFVILLLGAILGGVNMFLPNIKVWGVSVHIIVPIVLLFLFGLVIYKNSAKQDK